MTQGVAGQQGVPEPTPGGEAQKGGILGRTAMGAGWMFAWRMTTRVLGLASTLVLVRLLTPEDFGLFGLAFAVIATLETVLATGVDAQLVRARQTSRDLYDTVFTLNVIRGVTLALLMLVFAAPAAEFFREPRIEAVIHALALIPLLGGVANVGVAEFSRNLDFAKVFKLLIVPRLLQIAATLAAAIVFQSYWALIVGVMIGRAIATAFTYLVHAYRPRLTLKLWRELLGISFWTWATSIATAVRDRTGTFVIGRMLGMRDLGLLTVSHEIATLPTSEIGAPISQAAMPGLAAALRSPDRIRISDAFLRMLGLTLLVCLPATLGLSLVAGPVVVLLLGPRWLEAAPLIGIMAASYAAVPVSLICTALLDAQTRLKQIFLFVLLGVVLRLSALIGVLMGHGLVGFVVGIGIGLLFEALVQTAYCLRRLEVPFARAVAVAWRPLVGVSAMTGMLWGSGLGWQAPPPGVLQATVTAVQAVSLGAVTYGAVLVASWWLSGRPDGAETDLLAIGRRLLLPAGRIFPFLAPGAR